MTKLTFNIAANSPRSITRVKLRDLPDDTIYFGGPIVASGNDLDIFLPSPSRTKP